MTIRILGTGCAKCNTLESLVRQAITDLAMPANIEKVKDLNQITNYGVIMTPGLVINEQVKSAGKLPSLDQIKIWILETIG